MNIYPIFTTQRGVYNFTSTRSPIPTPRPIEPKPREPYSIGPQPRCMGASA